MTTSETTEAAKRELKNEFPDWSIVHTDTDRWWAMRTGHVVSEVIADTADLLREQLREVVAVDGQP